jgi:hypothetical protein
MEFTLVYQGLLKANGSIIDKQNIRREFHKQLFQLWNQQPLIGYRDFLEDNPPDESASIIHKIGNFRFAPLVTSTFRLIAELSITFLRPEPPGQIITQCGDIDNRLKNTF